LVRHYATWFGVDRVCAVKELQLLGVEIDAKYVRALATTLHDPTRRPSVAPSPAMLVADGYGSDSDDEFAFIAGVTSGGAPFGVTWDQMKEVSGADHRRQDASS